MTDPVTDPAVETLDEPQLAEPHLEPEPLLEVEPQAESLDEPLQQPVADDGVAAQSRIFDGLPALSRRQLLKLGAVAAPCLVGAGAIYGWLTGLAPAVEAIDPIVASYDATAHRWGFVVDTARCIGCGKCVVACKTENHVPPEVGHTRTWVERRTLTASGALLVDSPEAGIDGFASSAAPAANAVVSSLFVPHLCMQCENPPCVSVCPVGATYRTVDGVTLVDETRCIGCGYCVIACPYGARYLVPAGPSTPAGVAGVADKCTFCYHRVTRGQQPACVAICPVGARQFGDLNDPNSDVSVALANQPSRVLRPELGTQPRVHYHGLSDELAS
jgi:Fe-S-cluster-containing dehydrogenase component